MEIGFGACQESSNFSRSLYFKTFEVDSLMKLQDMDKFDEAMTKQLCSILTLRSAVPHRFHLSQQLFHREAFNFLESSLDQRLPVRIEALTKHVQGEHLIVG